MTAGRPWSPPTTPLLAAARQEALDKLALAGDAIDRLSLHDQTILAVSSAQGVIDNGGFQSFFGADWPGKPPYSHFSNAYRRIGAEGAAECIDKAVALFPFAHPELYEERRKHFLESISETHELVMLGDGVCGNVAVWELLEQYAKDQSGH